MSHVASSTYAITDLESLKVACEKRGLQLNLGQTTYKWWGYSVGDYPVPAGFKKEDLGKCEHAIVIPGDKGAYEVGVAKNPNGDGWVLVYDFYGQQKLKKQVGGELCEGLIQDYSLEAVKNTQDVRNLQMLGYTESIVTDEQTDDLIVIYES